MQDAHTSTIPPANSRLSPAHSTPPPLQTFNHDQTNSVLCIGTSLSRNFRIELKHIQTFYTNIWSCIVLPPNKVKPILFLKTNLGSTGSCLLQCLFPHIARLWIRVHWHIKNIKKCTNCSTKVLNISFNHHHLPGKGLGSLTNSTLSH